MTLGAVPGVATGLLAVGAVLGAAPSPTAPAQELDATSVGPGTEGFIWTFLVVLAVVLLLLNMVSRLRRLDRRRAQDERAQDQGARDEGAQDGSQDAAGGSGGGAS